MMIGVVAVLVIAAATTFAFLKMQKPERRRPSQRRKLPTCRRQRATSVPPVSPSAGATAPTSATNAIAHACSDKTCSGEAGSKNNRREEFFAGGKACPRGEASSCCHLGQPQIRPGLRSTT